MSYHYPNLFFCPPCLDFIWLHLCNIVYQNVPSCCSGLRGHLLELKKINVFPIILTAHECTVSVTPLEQSYILPVQHRIASSVLSLLVHLQLWLIHLAASISGSWCWCVLAQSHTVMTHMDTTKPLLMLSELPKLLLQWLNKMSAMKRTWLPQVTGSNRSAHIQTPQSTSLFQRFLQDYCMFLWADSITDSLTKWKQTKLMRWTL